MEVHLFPTPKNNLWEGKKKKKERREGKRKEDRQTDNSYVHGPLQSKKIKNKKSGKVLAYSMENGTHSYSIPPLIRECPQGSFRELLTKKSFWILQGNAEFFSVIPKLP